jgi:hypothetical protein
LLQSKRGQWISSEEIGHIGGLQYGARVHELRRLGYSIESRVERVPGTAGRRAIRRSWFRMPTDRQILAESIGMGKPVTDEMRARADADDSEPLLFDDLPVEKHRDDG